VHGVPVVAKIKFDGLELVGEPVIGIKPDCGAVCGTVFGAVCGTA